MNIGTVPRFIPGKKWTFQVKPVYKKRCGFITLGYFTSRINLDVKIIQFGRDTSLERRLVPDFESH